MAKAKRYNVLEFPGSMLQPGFSVYLFEILHNKERYFYVGMTGDNHYPSARSAINRLSGHFEKNLRSTQNMVGTSINKQMTDLDNATVRMYHWAIEGFQPWTEPLKTFSPAELIGKNKKTYDGYKEMQRKVLELERHLICLVRAKHNKRCFNKSCKEGIAVKEFQTIVNEVKAIIG